MKKLIVASILISAFGQFAGAASAPWYHAQALLKKTIGASPCFEVGRPLPPKDSSHEYTIAIQACSDTAAQSLAAVIKKDFGYVVIEVLKPSGLRADENSPLGTELKDTFDAAFIQNPYYVAFQPRGGFSDVTLEFKPEVVQFFSDNMADLYGMSNLVAADAFAQVLTLKAGKIRIGTTTKVKSAK